MHFWLPNLDVFSFWMGFIFSSFLWWIIKLLNPFLRNLFLSLRSTLSKTGNFSHGIDTLEQQYRKNLYSKAQGDHLASPLFSLDEIAVAPRFLPTPSFGQEKDDENRGGQIFSSIPYIPGWPELAGLFKVPTLGMEEILTCDTDFIIIGHPGTGKSFALAYMASHLASKELTGLHGRKLIPLYFHYLDLPAKNAWENPVYAITQIISGFFPVNEQSRIKDFLENVLEENRAIVFMDGLDELELEDINNAARFLKQIKKIYPDLKIIITAIPNFFDGLLSLNFSPISIASWSDEERIEFSHNWARQWIKQDTSQSIRRESERIDPALINSWQDNIKPIQTPLEMTLCLWGSYEGTLRGVNLAEILESSIERFYPHWKEIMPLSNTMLDSILRGKIEFESNVVEDLFFKSDKYKINTIPKEEKLNEDLQKEERESSVAESVSQNRENNRSSGGLLLKTRNNCYRISHIFFSSYIAAVNCSNEDIIKLIAKSHSAGRDTTLGLAFNLSKSEFISSQILAKPNSPLYTEIFNIGRWLRHTIGTQNRANKIRESLLLLIQNDNHPVGLRCQALISLLDTSSENQVADIFQQSGIDGDVDFQHLAALGLGALNNPTCIDRLSQLALNPSPQVRNSSCLALSIINTQESIDALSIILLNGTDEQRRSAAEAVSLSKDKGQIILREAAALDDIFVRRSAAYGLALIKETWAVDLLLKLQQDDPEWLVRSAAQDATESTIIKYSFSRKIPPPSEAPWIIEYAGKHGMGVVPDKYPLELLLSIFQTGNKEEKISSLAYLSTLPTPIVFRALYKCLYSGEPELREATRITLLEMEASGITLPDPHLLGS